MLYLERAGLGVCLRGPLLVLGCVVTLILLLGRFWAGSGSPVCLCAMVVPGVVPSWCFAVVVGFALFVLPSLCARSLVSAVTYIYIWCALIVWSLCCAVVLIGVLCSGDVIPRGMWSPLACSCSIAPRFHVVWWVCVCPGVPCVP